MCFVAAEAGSLQLAHADALALPVIELLPNKHIYKVHAYMHL